MSDESLPAIVLRRAAATPDRVAIRKKHLGRWRTYTWSTYADRMTAVARGLHSLGVGPGDRVAVHSDNRPAWLFADLATQALGGVTVGIYPTSPAAEVAFLLEHSGAKVLVAEDEEQADKALAVRKQLKDLERIVVIDPRGVDLDDPLLMSLAELEAIGREATELDVAASAAAVDLGEPAIIVYTSGTTGPPKGAMLSHRNLLAASATAEHTFGVDERTEVLSYLPLCHIAERLISVVDAVGHGYVVSFGEGPATFSQDLREVQPTFFLGVPRVWEKLLASVEIRMADAGWLKRAAYRWGVRNGRAIARHRWTGRFGPVDRLRYLVGWLVLYRPLREKLGLGRVRGVLSGAAPIAPEVLEWFWAIGVPVREGYGQTENTAQGTLTPADDVRLGAVGTPVPGVELRLAEDGEILTRGPGTFLGYYKDAKATKATVDTEGWLHTGDVGTLDDDGFLRITDRKKDIIITAGGKNISPSEIENRLKVSPFVREAVVIGDRRKHLVALVGIELDTVGAWALQNHVGFTTYADLSSKPQVQELVQGCVDKVNAELAQVEQVKAFALLPKELDPEDGEVTATQKVKRRAIEEQFGPMIEELYA